MRISLVEYLTSAKRIVRLWKEVELDAVPFVGAVISLKSDTLCAKRVEFKEGGGVEVYVGDCNEDPLLLSEQGIDDAIEDMIQAGWTKLSDVPNRSGRTITIYE